MNPIRLLAAAVLLVVAGQAMAGPAGCGAAEFRAMTYNIRLDTPADRENRWAMRRDLLFGQIRLLKPAVLGMQEVLPGQRADLVAALPGYQVLGGGRDGAREGGEASPLLVDRLVFRVVSVGMFWLSPTPDRPSRGWDAAYPRIATWAHLVRRSDGRRLLAVNTHWDHIGLQARLNGALQLTGWIAAHRREDEAVLVLGDFNAVLSEPSLQTLLSAGLRDAQAAAIEPVTGPAATFNGWTMIPDKAEAIDHILVGKTLAVRRYQVLAQHFDGRLASDHFPVIADLIFDAPGTCGGN